MFLFYCFMFYCLLFYCFIVLLFLAGAETPTSSRACVASWLAGLVRYGNFQNVFFVLFLCFMVYCLSFIVYLLLFYFFIVLLFYVFLFYGVSAKQIVRRWWSEKIGRKRSEKFFGGWSVGLTTPQKQGSKARNTNNQRHRSFLQLQEQSRGPTKQSRGFQGSTKTTKHSEGNFRTVEFGAVLELCFLFVFVCLGCLRRSMRPVLTPQLMISHICFLICCCFCFCFS